VDETSDFVTLIAMRAQLVELGRTRYAAVNREHPIHPALSESGPDSVIYA
jgi:hypothetical protein